MFKYNQGDKLKDSITGFEGVVTVRTDFINGCIRYGIQSPDLDKDGKPTDVEYFDEPQLNLVEPTKPSKKKKETGGPKPPTPKYR
jgi:hypothetical protein